MAITQEETSVIAEAFWEEIAPKVDAIAQKEASSRAAIRDLLKRQEIEMSTFDMESGW